MYMTIKSAIFGNQSASGRLYNLKTNTKNTTDSLLLHVKDEKDKKKDTTEKNSVNDALTRVRGGGYVVPPKSRV